MRLRWKVVEEGLKAHPSLLELFVLVGREEMGKKRRGCTKKGKGRCRMQRTLGGSRSIYSCNECFLNTYYGPLTLTAFQNEVLNKAEAMTA